ncbi:MAG: DUF47 family protein [Christensenella sp.]
MAKKHDFDYFGAFVTLADYACSASTILSDTLHHFNPDTAEESMNRIHEIEHSADDAKHKLMKVLIREFLPPIEREDITTLAQKIDDVTDAVEDVMVKIYTFNIREMRPEALEFMDIIVACYSSLKKAMEEFRNFKKSPILSDCIIEINALESDGDQLYTRAMRDLHVKSKDPIEIMVWSKTFNYFEGCCDACEDVANMLESIIMKNS